MKISTIFLAIATVVLLTGCGSNSEPAKATGTGGSHSAADRSAAREGG